MQKKNIIDIDASVTPAKSDSRDLAPETHHARREIIYISGTHFLIGAIIIMNLVIAAVIYREHNVEVFRATQAHNGTFTKITQEERAVKNDIVKIENAPKWVDTAYAKARPWTAQEEELK